MCAALALVVIALVGAGAAVAATRSAVTVKSAKNATLNTSIVVNKSGWTLYHLTSEKGKKFVCTGQCATIWPPLTVPKGSKPVAGPGITKSKLGTIKRPDGRIQVTYAGMTLYRYSADSKAGQTNGEGIQNIWYAISPKGTLVKKASSSGGGGYGAEAGTSRKKDTDLSPFGEWHYGSRETDPSRLPTVQAFAGIGGGRSTKLPRRADERTVEVGST